MTTKDASEPRFLAVDAGNSKTVAVVTDPTGHVLGRGRAGCGDIYGAASETAAVTAVFASIDDALAESHAMPGDISAAAFCMAGVDWPEDLEFWERRLRGHLGPKPAWTIHNDAFASMRLIDGTGTGVVITVGTGPAVAARSADGREQCSGFFVFDALGGSGLSDDGLRAAYRDWQGTGPPTELTPALLTHFGFDDIVELRHALTRRDHGLSERTRWTASRAVLATAAFGDPVAQEIVTNQARVFVGLAAWCAQRIGLDLADGVLPVLLNGSVVTSEHSAMRDALLAELKRVAPVAPVTVADDPPLAGVVLEALANGGIAISPDLLQRVRCDLPRDFLAT